MKRSFESDFWTGPKAKELTDSQVRLYCCLLTSPFLYFGLTNVSTQIIAETVGWSTKKVRKVLHELHDCDLIRQLRGWIWLPDIVFHQGRRGANAEARRKLVRLMKPICPPEIWGEVREAWDLGEVCAEECPKELPEELPEEVPQPTDKGEGIRDKCCDDDHEEPQHTQEESCEEPENTTGGDTYAILTETYRGKVPGSGKPSRGETDKLSELARTIESYLRGADVEERKATIEAFLDAAMDAKRRGEFPFEGNRIVEAFTLLKFWTAFIQGRLAAERLPEMNQVEIRQCGACDMHKSDGCVWYRVRQFVAPYLGRDSADMETLRAADVRGCETQQRTTFVRICAAAGDGMRAALTKADRESSWMSRLQVEVEYVGETEESGDD